MPSKQSRRRFLATGGLTSAVAIAGCLGRRTLAPATERSDTTPRPTNTPEPTPVPTADRARKPFCRSGRFPGSCRATGRPRPPAAAYSAEAADYGAIFRRAVFTAEIRNCVFVGCSFLGAEFRDVVIRDTHFLHGDLREIKSIGAKLHRSTIALASLKNANLSRGAISRSNLLDLDVEGLVLDDCPISKSRLARLDFRAAIVRRLRLPESVVVDCLWPEDVGFRAFAGATIVGADPG